MRKMLNKALEGKPLKVGVLGGSGGSSALFSRVRSCDCASGRY